MSGYLFPYTLPGIQYGYLRKPIWNTGLQSALSGKTSSIAYQVYPRVQFEYAFDLLRDGIEQEIQQVVGLFNAVRGRFDTFLHTDPDFNAASIETFGTGDGSTTAFQLTATYQDDTGPGQPEIIQNLKGTPVIYDNSSVVASSGYSIGATGIVTFTAAPAANAALAWSGNFYYRCRFDEDHYDWKKIMSGIWQSPKVSFTSVIL